MPLLDPKNRFHLALKVLYPFGFRHLIQQASGFLTGSVYNYDRYKEKGFPGEGVMDSSVLAVKTHEMSRANKKFNLTTRTYGNGQFKMYDMAILLVRDPYQAILSEFNRKKSGHTSHAQMENFKSEKWPKFVTEYTKLWREFHHNWVEQFKRYVSG